MTTAATQQLEASDLPSVFSDLDPIPQDDGKFGVCRIDYKPQFVQAYDYFRAVIRKDERSDRALQLTALCLKLNPANYTVWHYRRRCLFDNDSTASDKGLEEILRQDFELASELGGSNPKNYQIWYHRRALLEELVKRLQKGGDKDETSNLLRTCCQKELEYLESVAVADGKNYHAWSHRQFVVKTLVAASSPAEGDDVVWQSELEYTDRLIGSDIRNNSAWNHRWFVSHGGNLKGEAGTLSERALKRETEYALEKARLDPYNESPWRYLIAVIKDQLDSCNDEAGRNSLLDEYVDKVWGVRKSLEEVGKNPDSCSNLISALCDVLEWRGDAKSLQRVVELTKSLAEEHDVIRTKYWKLRQRQAEEELQQAQAAK